jgi:hypothetical protein
MSVITEEPSASTPEMQDLAADDHLGEPLPFFSLTVGSRS